MNSFKTVLQKLEYLGIIISIKFYSIKFVQSITLTTCKLLNKLINL